MDFLKALKLMKEGKEVRRRVGSEGLIRYLKGSMFKWRRKDGYNAEKNIQIEEIEATDWEEV